MLPEERAILADPALSRYATTLVARQGDRGVEAVPDLLLIFGQLVAFDPGRYGCSDLSEGIEAVRRAFRHIGPDAAFARPEIEELLASEAMDHRYNRLSKREWDTLLVVLGRPVETLDKPENLSGSVESYRARIASSAARPWDPLRDR